MKELFTALLGVQSDLKAIIKTESNPAYIGAMYFDINTVVAELRPIFTKHKLVVLQPLTELNGKPAIETLILGETGEMFSRVTPLIEKEDAQKYGGVITYTRRYALTSMFLIEGEKDDDGESAKSAPKASHSPVQSATGNGAKCSKCGAGMAISKATGKEYCSAKCWLNPTPAVKSDDIALADLPF